MKILITGFEPFGEAAQNASMEIVKQLPTAIGDTEIETAILPVVFGTCVEQLLKTIENVKPDAVLCLGMAGGYPGMAIERYAFNLMNNVGRPDNGGNIYDNALIEAVGPAAYAARLPIHEIKARMLKAEVPSYLGDAIGAYVCNNLMYGLLHYIESQAPELLGGFIHVPYFTEQVLDRPKTPSLPLEKMVRGIECAVEALAACAKS